MALRFFIVVAVALGIHAGLAAAPGDLPPASSKQIEFARDIAPLLESRCQVCHGPQVQMKGLRLDRREDALRGSLSGPVIRPGKSADSKLIRMVAGHVEGKVMPPAGERLSDEQIGLLRAWIDQGVDWPEARNVTLGNEPPKSSHWAFQPVRRPINGSPATQGHRTRSTASSWRSSKPRESSLRPRRTRSPWSGGCISI